MIKTDFKMLRDLKVKNRQTKQSQIADFIRNKILSGEFSTDYRLPPTKILAKECQMPEVTVHRALSVLVKEGLLSRKPKIGTIVNKPNKKLERVAVYVNQDLRHPASIFSRILLKCLEESLEKSNIALNLVFDIRKGDGLNELKSLVERRVIQGIITMSVDPICRAALAKLPVPFSCITTAQIANRVYLDDRTKINNIVKGLKLQSCKTTGILMPKLIEKDPTESGEKNWTRSFNMLLKELNDSGIEVRPEWIHVPEKKYPINLSTYNNYAFKGIRKIMSSSSAPDGLVIVSDDLMVGALLGLSSLPNEVSKKLKLVICRNHEFQLPCPVPCYYVENSIMDTAEGLVDIVIKQFNGETIKTIKVKQCLTKYEPDFRNL